VKTAWVRRKRGSSAENHSTWLRKPSSPTTGMTSPAPKEIAPRTRRVLGARDLGAAKKSARPRTRRLPAATYSPVGGSSKSRMTPTRTLRGKRRLLHQGRLPMRTLQAPPEARALPPRRLTDRASAAGGALHPATESVQCPNATREPGTPTVKPVRLQALVGRLLGRASIPARPS